MKNIAVIDADLIGRKRHRFPNLVCMKLSGYHKNMGDKVILKTDYEKLDSFDKVYIAKVFTDTKIPSAVLLLPNVEYGGTGFFYDKAVPLPEEIEHHKPDYHLYDAWVKKQLAQEKRGRSSAITRTMPSATSQGGVSGIANFASIGIMTE